MDMYVVRDVTDCNSVSDIAIVYDFNLAYETGQMVAEVSANNHELKVYDMVYISTDFLKPVSDIQYRFLSCELTENDMKETGICGYPVSENWCVVTLDSDEYCIEYGC